MLSDSTTLKIIYDEGKYWITILGWLYGAFKAVEWVKKVRTQDLPEIKQSMASLKDGVETQTESISNGLEKQTTSFVSELRELRQDIRGLYSHILPVPHVRMVKALKNGKHKPRG